MKYELAVIGGGPGGYTAAIAAAKRGLNTLLIESNQLGGTCLNRGCIPTKALLFCTERYYNATSSEKFGVRADVSPFDYDAAFRHKEQTVRRLRTAVEHLVRQNGITLINGTAEFEDSSHIRVNQEIIGFDKLIVATGSVPKPYPFDVVDGSNLLNSDDFLALSEMPESFLIIGGGVIGLEFATILARIGRKVILLSASDRILSTTDPELAQIVQRELKSLGVTFYTGTTVRKIYPQNGKTSTIVKQGDNQTELCTDAVLCVIGRMANTQKLHPERVGLKMRGSYIEINEYCQTSIPSVYAIGDVNGYSMLAHAASWQGTQAVEHITGKAMEPFLFVPVPTGVYTDPELASVGLTEEEAKKQGFDYKVNRVDAPSNGKMLSMGRRFGFVKIISEQSSGKILGVQIAAPHATEMIAELTLAMNSGITVSQLAHTVHPHPTISEMIMDAASQSF